MLVAALIFLSALLAQDWALTPDLPSQLTEKELSQGKELYSANCQRCHGADGDDASQEGITPLGGLSLRLGDPRNRNFGGPSFRARGRIYSPVEAKALMGYILTLRGEKGFSRPEALVSPCLLSRKQTRRTYLVIDLRPEADFRAAHVGGAANLPPKALAKLAHPAMGRDLSNRIVILYDEGSGLQASKVWRALVQSGHRTVAVLDGGFERWVAEDRDITSAVSATLPSVLLIDSPDTANAAQPPAERVPLPELDYDWQKTVTDNGLRPASELTGYLRSIGFKGAGRYRLRRGSKAADLLAFELHLLGYAVLSSRNQEIVIR
ncbi:MAG: hypothetical protein EHM61_14095 [Acidobacteria bacterium]|nr:MAG: hypothetical protein EHM61_14095 [Acidobacteriota bacterium]